jgi:hypothetical protein
MAETALDYSPLAPAIEPCLSGRSPTREGRRQPPTAALFCSRQYGFGDEFASGVRVHRAPPPRGGALGAYQAGVYEALAERDLHPNWIAGISIGAVYGALIAGNAPDARVDKLGVFTFDLSQDGRE